VPITYRDLRQALSAFDDDLASADAALQSVGEGDVRVVVDLHRVRLDIRGNGNPANDEAISWLISTASYSTSAPVEVKFDASDVPWFIGVSHALMGLCDFLLSHDFERTFDVSAHLVFSRPRPAPSDLLLRQGGVTSFGLPRDFLVSIAEAVSLAHTINWPVTDLDRMRAARLHLKTAVTSGRKALTSILAETGDDREWMPNPRQTHASLGWKVTQQQVDRWMVALEESEAILDGQILLPYRYYQHFGLGMDLRVFLEWSRNFDLVMLLTGAGAVPYMREGPISSGQRWYAVTTTFGNALFNFAAYFD
jgi:hypothetical protein